MASPTGGSESATARFAVETGRRLLAVGDVETALRWLDRARRLAPDDPTVGLVRASALLEHDRAACREALVALLARHQWFRDARVLLVACELRDRQPARALLALVDLLAVSAPPADPGFRRIADLVARDGGAPGWLGMTAGGIATVSRIAPGRSDVEIRLDGARLPLPHPAGSRPAGVGMREVALPEGWRGCRELTAIWRGTQLAGSPLAIEPFTVTEGVVGWEPGTGLTGWAWHPADPDQPVVLEARVLDDRTGALAVIGLVAREAHPGRETSDSTDRHRGFQLDPDALPHAAEVRVLGMDGRQLAGSPVQLGREQAATAVAAARLGHPGGAKGERLPTAQDRWRPLDAGLLARGPPPVAGGRAAPRRRPLDVVIPVFRGAADFRACLATLRGQIPRDGRIVVVDDASPDQPLCQAVAEAEAAGVILVLRHDENRGFPAAANTGLRFSAEAGARDVLLLNSDTLAPPGALPRLAAAAYADGAIGSVTPMTNDGTILSYPRTDAANAVPDAAETARLDAAFHRAHGGRVVDIPTAIGFCMFMRHDCLADTGLLREDAFAQGYGEENDWSLRARHLGWRHAAAAGVFVGHVGGQSFGAVKSHLIARNARMLNRLHPGYDRLIADFIARDPLAPIRRGADIARWRGQRADGGAVALITHDMGGGVARHMRERCAAIRADGQRPIVLRPGIDGMSCRVTDGAEGGFENLVFALPAELDDLAAFLAEDRPRCVELHHLLGHSPDMLDLARRLGVGLDVYIHDYAQWCPRITLVSHGDKYCGEPARVEDCVACVADLGDRIRDPIGVAALRERSAGVLRGAREIIAPSLDAAKRMQRHFPFARPSVRAWENDSTLLGAVALARLPAATSADGRIRIVVAGAIGYDKGYDVLLACARDAARRDLAVEFIVVGHTVDDARLLDTGRVFVTGRYEEAEGAAMVMARNGTLGFIPSVWPETWCYALSTLWRGGLRVAAFDIGAQAERIRRADAGWLVPIGLPAPRLNDLLSRLAAAA